MADRLETYSVTVPPGTTQAAPLVSPLAFPAGYLIRWEVIIPDGVAGLAGFAFTYSGQRLIPDTVGGWVTGNDEKITDDVHYDFVGNQWALLGYNSGLFPHTFLVRLYVNEIGHQAANAPTAAPATLIDVNGGPTVNLTSPLTPDDVNLPDLSGPPLDLSAIVGLDLPANVTDPGASTIDSTAPAPSTDITPDVADDTATTADIGTAPAPPADIPAPDIDAGSVTA